MFEFYHCANYCHGRTDRRRYERMKKNLPFRNLAHSYERAPIENSYVRRGIFTSALLNLSLCLWGCESIQWEFPTNLAPNSWWELPRFRTMDLPSKPSKPNFELGKFASEASFDLKAIWVGFEFDPWNSCYREYEFHRPCLRCKM